MLLPAAVPFEALNLEAYQLLLRIEVLLRELIRTALQSEHGTSWHKRLLGDQLTRIRAMERDESSRPQFDFLRLGPLYYLTLGELLPILQQPVGRKVTEQLGGERFLEQLTNLLPARN